MIRCKDKNISMDKIKEIIDEEYKLFSIYYRDLFDNVFIIDIIYEKEDVYICHYKITDILKDEKDEIVKYINSKVNE